MSELAQQRIEAMRKHGVFWCPDWCLQPDDEHHREVHVAAPVEIDVPVDDAQIVVTPTASWFTNADGTELAEKDIRVATTAEVWLDADGLALLRAALDDAEGVAADWEYAYVAGAIDAVSKPAWPGADSEPGAHIPLEEA